MSAGFGFKKLDGIVLCADSCELDGFVKGKSSQKVRTFGVPGEWEVAVALLGGTALGDSFWGALTDALLGGVALDEQSMRKNIEDVLKVQRKNYRSRDDTFRVLVGLYGPMCNPTLYVQTEAMLSAVDRVHVGLAPELCEFLLDTLDERSSSVHDAERVAVLAMGILADRVEGIERPIQVIKYVDPLVNHIKGREAESCGHFEFGDAQKIEKAIKPKLDAQLDKVRGKLMPSTS